MLPLVINLSKKHTDFIIEFFFKGEDVTDDNEEEMRNMLMNYSKFSTKKQKKEENINKSIETEIKIGSSLILTETHDKHDKEDIKPIDYPIFFKQFKIDETELNVSYIHAENSYLVIYLFKHWWYLE